jgi:hypothetical protein
VILIYCLTVRSPHGVMSYERQMIAKLAMPQRGQIQAALLRQMLARDGVIKEFGESETVIDELADQFGLNSMQRHAVLETVYRRENRVKKSSLWHRILFRAADELSRQGLVSRPTATFHLTQRREWMLTEKGFDAALKLCDIPATRRDSLLVASFEVCKIARDVINRSKPTRYSPIDTSKVARPKRTSSMLRRRGFRRAVVEAYGLRCAVCGLKINAPDGLTWEVEAAHIVPNHAKGRDDIWNGIAMCRLHHWAFDAGWFTFNGSFGVMLSDSLRHLPADYGIFGTYDFLRALADTPATLMLPAHQRWHPDITAIRRHNHHIFSRRAIR